MNLRTQICKGPFVLLIATMVLIVVAVGFTGEHTASTRTIASSDRSRRVSSANAQMLSALRDAEASQRGYLLTGLPDYVRPFGKSQEDVLDALLRLDDLTHDNRAQDKTSDQLSLLISEKLDELRLTLEIYDTQGPAAAIALLKTNRGRILMERIRTLSVNIDETESRHLNALQSTLHSRLSRTRATVVAGGIILFLLVVFAQLIIRDETRQQRKLTATLHASQSDLREKLVEIEHKKEVLATNEQHLRLAFETTGMSSWWWAPDENRIHWSEGNNRAFHVSGLVRYASWDRMLAQVHSDDRAPVREAIFGAIRARSEFEVECRTRGDQKQCRWISVKGQYFSDRNNQPGRIIGVLRDITKQRRSQEALRETELQLQHSQKMDAVGRLAGGVAHDFNNLLTVISGYTELLSLDRSLNGKSRQLLSEVQKAAGRATRLTKQLLCFSRKELIQPTSLDLNAVVTSMFDMLRRLVGTDIEIHVNACAVPVPIRADPGHIEQVIMNLVVNARDAMPNGGSLTLSTYTVVFTDQLPHSSQVIDAGNYSVLTVTDTGTGMTSEVQAKLFEPFFTTKNKGHGTGLGLSTVFGILQQNRAKALVHSEIGKGSRFEIYFPLLKEPADVVAATQPVGQVGAGTETILVVEDEPCVREFVSQALRSVGYSVLEAADGLQGLEKGQRYSRKIDLILTDLTMPVMGGFQMVAKLTELQPDLAALYMSGYYDSELKKNGKADRLKLIQKPFTSNELLKAVRQALDSKDAIASVVVNS